MRVLLLFLFLPFLLKAQYEIDYGATMGCKHLFEEFGVHVESDQAIYKDEEKGRYWLMMPSVEKEIDINYQCIYDQLFFNHIYVDGSTQKLELNFYAKNEVGRKFHFAEIQIDLTRDRASFKLFHGNEKVAYQGEFILMAWKYSDEMDFYPAPKKVGKHESFYWEGTPFAQLQYDSLGFQHGIQKYYYPNQQLKSSKEYKEGRQAGLTKTFYANGNAKSEEEWAIMPFCETADKIKSKSWNEEGVLIKNSFMDYEKRKGELKEYYANGNIRLDVKLSLDADYEDYLKEGAEEGKSEADSDYEKMLQYTIRKYPLKVFKTEANFGNMICMMGYYQLMERDIKYYTQNGTLAKEQQITLGEYTKNESYVDEEIIEGIKKEDVDPTLISCFAMNYPYPSMYPNEHNFSMDLQEVLTQGFDYTWEVSRDKISFDLILEDLWTRKAIMTFKDVLELNEDGTKLLFKRFYENGKLAILKKFKFRDGHLVIGSTNDLEDAGYEECWMPQGYLYSIDSLETISEDEYWNTRTNFHANGAIADIIKKHHYVIRPTDELLERLKLYERVAKSDQVNKISCDLITDPDKIEVNDTESKSWYPNKALKKISATRYLETRKGDKYCYFMDYIRNKYFHENQFLSLDWQEEGTWYKKNIFYEEDGRVKEKKVKGKN